jgi:hypothetical protein
MKIKYCFATLCACVISLNVMAADRDSRFKREVQDGLYGGGSLYRTTNVAYGNGYGELAQEVFYDVPSSDGEDYELFIPTKMYVRMGGGMNIGALTKSARVGHKKHESRGSWNTLIGLGWNMSSYVRTEVAFQESTFKFDGLSDLYANYHMLNGMLYFDFARRYIQSGDITYRRTFVPFMGVGLGLGAYDFAGTHGANGAVLAAPRMELGMNFMLTDLLGIDIAYQHQLLIGHGFGWSTRRIGVDNVGNIMATIRMNF